MHIKIILLYIIGVIMIREPIGSFNYQNYHQLAYVVEGTLVNYQYDSLTVIVNKVWTGNSQPGDRLTFSHDFELDLQINQQGLFMADSSKNLTIHGLIRDGFYRMIGFSSPNLLSVDDLEALSSGITPSFNQHISNVTVHFPLSDEEVNLHVTPSGTNRIAETDLSSWNTRTVIGSFGDHSDYTTVLGLFPSNEEELNTPFLLAGDIQRYSNDVYFVDLWPKYPAFSSVASYDRYYEHGTIPIYTFQVEPNSSNPRLIDLPNEIYLLSDGEKFYLTGQHGITPQVGITEGFDILFPVFTSPQQRVASSHILFSFQNLSNSPGRPLLITILEALDEGELTAFLYYVKSDESTPEFYSKYTINFNSISYKIISETPASIDIDNSVISFTRAGESVLYHNGSSYTQINGPITVSNYGNNFRKHNSVLFEHPYDSSRAILLHFSSIYNYSSHYNTSDFLIARLIEASLQDEQIEGTLYEVDLSSDKITEITSFVLQKQ